MTDNSTYRIWKKCGRPCEIHRFYMKVISILRRKHTLKSIARILGLSVDTLKSWSCGKKLPNSKNAEKIFMLLILEGGKDYEYFIENYAKQTKGNFTDIIEG